MQERRAHAAALQLERVWGLTGGLVSSRAGDCVAGLSLVVLHLTDDMLKRGVFERMWDDWTVKELKGRPADFVLRRGDI